MRTYWVFDQVITLISHFRSGTLSPSLFPNNFSSMSKDALVVIGIHNVPNLSSTIRGDFQHVTRRSIWTKIKEIDSHVAYLASSHNDAVWLSQLSRTRLTKYKENIRQLLIIPSSPLPHGAALQLFTP
jgi:hypothetical protein